MLVYYFIIAIFLLKRHIGVSFSINITILLIFKLITDHGMLS
jgi:hypothetical protein